jgi:4-amino-4-deoxy-L-arabinose transferase-like glycosyltransferase
MRMLQRMTAWFRHAFAQFPADWLQIRQTFSGFRLTRLDAGVGVLIVLAAFYNRLVLLYAPMRYDEAYTFMGFARHSFWYVVSNYELPNNHVFHTLLVKLSTLFFGISPAAIRLPAFIAGMLLIPLSFWVGWRLYNSKGVGFAAAAVLAYWPVVTAYAANARGYSLLMLFTLCLVSLGAFLVRHPNRIGWLAFALISALGLYTVPVMIYPIGTVLIWMLVSVILGEGKPEYSLSRFIIHLGLAGLLSLGLAVILYLPILVYSGWRSLLVNRFVVSYTYPSFFAHLPEWGMGFWVSWTDSSLFIVGLVLVGFFSEWFLFRKPPGQRLSITMIMLVWVVAVLLIQHPELNPKILVSLVPLILLSAVAGWHALLQRLSLPSWLPRLLLACVICISFWGIFRQAQLNLPYLLGKKNSHEQAAEFMVAHYEPSDIVLTAFPVGSQVWYYCYLAGIPADRMVDYQEKTFMRAWLVVDQRVQTLEDVIQMAEDANTPVDRQKTALAASFDQVSIYLYQP